MNQPGTLYLCATPIGNLEDITFRVLRILKEVNLIAAEDTRQTVKLLNHFEIKTPMTSYYEHNKAEKGQYLLKCLMEGQNVALVSDAGTPGISDPGEDLVKLCRQNGVPVSPVPGPVAAISALIASGLPTGRFSFEGFLSVNKRSRKAHLESIKKEPRTLIFYEAPHKLKNTLKDLLEMLGNRDMAIGRELTKRYEEIFQCTIEEAVEKYQETVPKGEFVLVIRGADEKAAAKEEEENWNTVNVKDHIEMYLVRGIERKEALKLVAKDRGMTKREIYAIQLKEK